MVLELVVAAAVGVALCVYLVWVLVTAEEL